MQLRHFSNVIKEEMVKAGLTPKGKSHGFYISFIVYKFVGLVTDGEFNSLRAKGATRPLSVLQIKTDCRKKFSKLSTSTMQAMITITGKLEEKKVYVEATMLNPIGVMPNGEIQTIKPDLCSPQSLLCKIFQLKAQGKSLADTIDILRKLRSLEDFQSTHGQKVNMGHTISHLCPSTQLQA